jgi:hypothetical protein
MPMPPARPASEAFPVVRRAGYGASTLLSTFLTDRPVRPCFPDTVERMFAEDRDERKCSFPECNRAYYAKALCRAHYQQQLHKRPLQPIRPWRRVPTECEFEGCDKKATNRGLCPAHALQRNKGQELRPLRPFYGTKGPCRFDGCLKPRAPAFSRFVPLVQSPHRTHEREATLVGQVKELKRRVNRTGHLVHFERTPGPWLETSRGWRLLRRARRPILRWAAAGSSLQAKDGIRFSRLHQTTFCSWLLPGSLASIAGEATASTPP